jgi:hypothetical protein
MVLLLLNFSHWFKDNGKQTTARTALIPAAMLHNGCSLCRLTMVQELCRATLLRFSRSYGFYARDFSHCGG